MTARKQAVCWLISLGVLIILIWLLSSILLPFVAGIAVAYFLNPPTGKLEAGGLSRTLSTSIVLVIFFILILLTTLMLMPVLLSQVSGISDRLPGYVATLRDFALPWLINIASPFGIDFSSSAESALKEVAVDTVGLGFKVLIQAWGGGLALFNILGLLIIAPVVAFYLLRDYDHLVSTLDGWLPRQYASTIRGILVKIDCVMANFIRGQGTVCLILASFYAVSLTAVGLEFGLIIGLFSGLISFVPFIGALLGLALSLLTALTQFLPESAYVSIGLVVAIFIIGQVAESQFLTPRLLGSRIGLHPVWVMFSLLAGSALFGFVGVLIAVPVAAAIGVVVRFALTQYLEGRLYFGHDEQSNSGDEP